MSIAPPANRLRYPSTRETPEKGEAKTARKLVAVLRKITETTYRDGGHALRAVHAKSHGLLTGELIVAEGLPEILAQGLVAIAGRHPAVLRFSTTPGDILDHNLSTPRGLAVEILDVEGVRLPGSEDAKTQDFLLVDGKAFSGPNGNRTRGEN